MAKKPVKQKPRAKNSSQVIRSEEQYKATGDFRYVVLALGSSRNDSIPHWALDACRDYYARWEINHLTPIKEPKWVMPADDNIGRLLDVMADRIISQYDTLDRLRPSKASINAAAVHAANDDGHTRINSVIQQLTRAWNAEQANSPASVSTELQDHITMHPRMERAYFRNKRKQQP